MDGMVLYRSSISKWGYQGMNALEFFANITRYGGYEYYGEETTVLLPSEENKAVYYHMWTEGDGYFYEYLILTPREEKYEWFYLHFIMEIENLSYEKQYEIIRRMETMEIEFEPVIHYDKLNNWYLVSDATCEKYPLYSVRGTCNMEQECKCEPVCCKVNDEPCCFNKKVGVSRTSAIKYPEYYEFLPELAVWMAVCPDLDVLYVLHEDAPRCSLSGGGLNFPLAFLLKDNKITYIEDEEEVKRLYEEYHKKYPCDTKEIEEDMKSEYESPDFHF